MAVTENYIPEEFSAAVTDEVSSLKGEAMVPISDVFCDLWLSECIAASSLLLMALFFS